MTEPYLNTPLARHIWETKYRLQAPEAAPEPDIEATWWRVARSLAAVESREREHWARRFYAILEDFRFLPGGRILAGAGSGQRVTLFNCFVMGVIEDSLDGIFERLKEGALTMQAGGGVGYDFSTLRPAGSMARHSGRIASGPVSFMRIWDAMCATIMSTGSRRGAMIGSLRCDHPDIEAFVDAKREPGALRHFNLSVQITDAFMQAIEEDADWPLLFPLDQLQAGGQGEVLEREWTGRREPVPCRVFRRLPARELWERIMRAAYETAEPGVLFIDRINALNNLGYREQITTTNPCGEIPLPPYGACDLGSINLPRFVQAPFSRAARLDLEGIRETVILATRLLDNVIDASQFPLPAQAEQARGARRIGLGITGLADALIMLGLHYGEPPARRLAAEVMQTVCHAAYRSSLQLAQEKGGFPFLEAEAYLQRPFIRALPADIRQGIAAGGIRNSHLTAIAPNGTISLLAGNVSSGIEPVFDFHHRRRVLDAGGGYRVFEVEDYAYRLWQQGAGAEAEPPPFFVNARTLAPQAHLEMQAALQPFVDNAISKTINVPEDYPFEAFRGLYHSAYRAGVKGCTTFRPTALRGSVLISEGEAGLEEGAISPHCCSIEREAD
ncbi:adenosylcobalamin-dependent ribonucleoside-diphosphate reductase [Thiohalobacter sp. IOR34]|uniref:adenosylcobalamin-dependent ribonucleoside-diphosphate reductase n=1 Tax=Thiohalobacter sp. IOR34 TaxID=3057176 RepID=UPI0025AF9CEE|nr:adenosylcobalamin-dependent ribonucleoside-diphosphate reductase [Thiohalobacter sp. IOR34]WJW76570.1 adenosylcobalamin-dependent ribonucleoside-diphosphate reductase [Thiohalobacter sp. IOR34]